MVSDKLSKLEKASEDYLLRHWSNGGSCEFDGSINDVSRDKIDAMKDLHPEVFLGKINRYDDDKEKDYLVPYTGQKVYNFEYAFAIPVKDKIVRKLLQAREISGMDGKWIMENGEQIISRVLEIGGVLLQWS